jgi:hypothetical protein
VFALNQRCPDGMLAAHCAALIMNVLEVLLSKGDHMARLSDCVTLLTSQVLCGDLCHLTHMTDDMMCIR